MSVPFAFVPRQVSRPTKVQGTEPPKTPSVVPQRARSPSPVSDSEDDSKAPEAAVTDKDKKGKQRAVDSHTHDVGRDIAALALLALSDYRIWSDADLRNKLDGCLNTSDTSAAGFVPINYLIRRPPFRGFLPAEPSEVEVVKALRSYANDALEVRMLVSAPSSSVWYGTGKTSRKKDVGGYEVRRKDWETLLDHPLRHLSPEQWDKRTLYMECVPTQYRSLAGIARFTQALLPLPPSSPPSQVHVQNVTLPPHYLDKPGDIPKCRGYALVTFSTTEQRDALLHVWPWKRGVCDITDHRTPEVKEAQRFGFRTISKARWDQLNEEYVAYRHQLVDEIFEASKHAPSNHRSDIPSGTDVSTRVRPEDEGFPTHALASRPPGGTPKTTIASPYPYGCLIFVRNIHSGTNKTTLKTLFAKAFEGKGKPTGLDYVDFNKGMDSCYLRLTSPNHTAVLTEHFTRHPTVQANGLDTGRAPSENERPIKMELIEGKKEELYWKNIPEKVCRQAVEKALEAEQPIDVSCPNASMSGGTATTRGAKKRKR